MVGIVSYGAYIPMLRMSRDVLGQVWGKSAGRGEKAIANVDEDSITMAVEAVVDSLTGMDRQKVDAIYFASVSAPYREKQSASIVKAAADLRDDIDSADFGNSIRSGTNALNAALNAVKAGAAKRVAVVASDSRVPAPASDMEPNFGDGAAAFIIGDSDVAVSVEGSYSVSSEFLDVWLKAKDKYHWTWEDRFVKDEGLGEDPAGGHQGRDEEVRRRTEGLRQGGLQWRRCAEPWRGGPEGRAGPQDPGGDAAV